MLMLCHLEIVSYIIFFFFFFFFFLFFFLGATAQLKPWPPPQNSAKFFGRFSTISFSTG
jgi:hypothetical protein